MIYCVIPEPMADELFDKLSAYYVDDPNVTVIIDRRKQGGPRAPEAGGPSEERRLRDRGRRTVADDAAAHDG